MENKTIVAFLLGLGIGGVSAGGLVCAAAVKARLREISCFTDINNDGLEDVIVTVDRQHPMAFLQTADHNYVEGYVAVSGNWPKIRVDVAVADRTYNVNSCIVLPRRY